MSDNKDEATYYGGYRGGESWNPAPLARFGAVTPPSTERPTISPGPAPWAPHEYNGAPKGPRWLLLVALVLAAGLVLALIFIERSGSVPAGVPVIGQDKGLAVCEAMASDRNPIGDGPEDELTTAEIREVRSLFSASRYAEIREPGVKLMDMVAQISAMGEDDMGLLMFARSFTETYAALSGGCAEHGYEIPALGA